MIILHNSTRKYHLGEFSSQENTLSEIGPFQTQDQNLESIFMFDYTFYFLLEPSL